MTDFVGRRRELKELREDIARTGLDTLSGRKAKAPRARVLLVAGRPGSGRTALAEAFVREVAEQYPDGVLRTRLTASGGQTVATERALRGLLEGLGQATPPGAGEDELSSALRTALDGRRVVILVDDAADPHQVDALLPDTPECLVVVTAEGPLTGIPDVRPCTLGGLDTPSAVEMLAQRIGDTRVTADPRAAEALAEECGGQPAALALVGGWLAAHPKASVADVAKQLHDMPAGVGGALARGFRLVYESLPQPAQRTLRLLPLAPAGIVDSHSASALAGCSVAAAQSTLDDFAGLGLLHHAHDGLLQLPGCLAPLLQALLEARSAPPRSSSPGPGCWSAPYGCCTPAGPWPNRTRMTGSACGRSWRGCRAPCASPTGGPPPPGWTPGCPRSRPPPPWPWPTGSWTPWPAA